MDLASAPVRVVASVIDAACASLVAFYVFLVLDLFSPPGAVVALVVAVVFLGVRLLSALLLDVSGRGTPGRFLLSAAVVDWRGDPIPARVAVGRRALADAWFFLPLGLGIAVAAFFAGVPPASFARFDGLVVLLVWLDAVFLGLALVWHASGGWAVPHDHVFGTLVAVAERDLLVTPERGPMMPTPEGLDAIPGLKDRPHLQSLWNEMIAAPPSRPEIDLATCHLPRADVLEELK